MANGMTNPAAPASPGERPRPTPGYPTVLQRQPALVTGANSVIGKAVALGLAPHAVSETSSPSLTKGIWATITK